MIPSYQLHSFRIPQLETRQQGDGFDRMQASIDVVAEKEVICMRCFAADSESFYQVVELPGRSEASGVRLHRNRELVLSPMYIPNYRHRCTDMHDITFAHEYLFCLFTYFP